MEWKEERVTSCQGHRHNIFQTKWRQGTSRSMALYHYNPTQLCFSYFLSKRAMWFTVFIYLCLYLGYSFSFPLLGIGLHYNDYYNDYTSRVLLHFEAKCHLVHGIHKISSDPHAFIMCCVNVRSMECDLLSKRMCTVCVQRASWYILLLLYLMIILYWNERKPG